MREATEKDLSAILPYLRESVQDCLYMYIDISKYGLNNPNMNVWLDEDEQGICLVVMKYHTGVAVYSDRESWDLEGVVKIIRDNKAMSITGKREMVEQLMTELSEEYNVTYGTVFEFTKYMDLDYDGTIEEATEEDTLEIAKLISIDEGIGSYYDVQNLANQLAERMKTKMGRSYIIRRDGVIIAHIASYAEHDGLATTSGLIVAPEYRNELLGSILERYLVEQLKADGFKVYTFITERLRERLLSAMGNEIVGKYGKMAIKGEQ